KIMLDPYRKKLTLVIAVWVALMGALTAGCSRNDATGTTTDRVIPAEITPSLLPTPTLAAPANFDPLRPPTPVVLPSPAPSSGDQTDIPTEAVEAELEAAPLTPADD